MALLDTDLMLVNRNNVSYKASVSEVQSKIAGDGTITIEQNGQSDQTFTVNQTGDTTIVIDNQNTTYTAGDGITLTGTEFSVAGNDGLDQDADGLSVDATVVRTTGDQTIDGVKSFQAAVKSDLQTIPSTGVWNISGGNLWLNDAAVIQNPGDATPGATGVIYCRVEVTGWGINFVFAEGVQPECPIGTVIPYYVTDTNVIRLGYPTPTV